MPSLDTSGALGTRFGFDIPEIILADIVPACGRGGSCFARLLLACSAVGDFHSVHLLRDALIGIGIRVFSAHRYIFISTNGRLLRSGRRRGDILSLFKFLEIVVPIQEEYSDHHDSDDRDDDLFCGAHSPMVILSKRITPKQHRSGYLPDYREYGRISKLFSMLWLLGGGFGNGSKCLDE